MLGLIWAQDADGVIGADNTIPWRLPEDQAHFKATTLGAAVIMGRHTWESLPASVRPLPGRVNIVISRNPGFEPEGALVVSTVADAIDRARGPAWVMGGEQVYAGAMDHADTIVVTTLAQHIGGDRHAPTIGPQWRLCARDPAEGWHRSVTGLDYRIDSYHRRQPTAAGPGVGKPDQRKPG